MGFKKQSPPPDYDFYDSWEYRTGATAPQKSHRGIIAILLVAVIILGGAVSILSILNIQLFRQLAKDSGETLPFSLINTAPEGNFTSWDSIQQEPIASRTPDDSAFSPTASGNPVLSPDSIPQDVPESTSVHGICGDPVSAFNQHYYALPQGLYITKVISGSCAAAAGLRSGDILLTINGVPVTGLQTLADIFSACEPGTEVTVSLYRNGKTVSLSFFISTIHP